ncbi:GNAT family N-acetyltransferase [Cellulophaga sp. Hel_I_12]|uniref:GNAT family N-acetyltransferase n=1 Tax=Cellulophaga sp. Hel_I_12 TaxID=1249972 RepID=UPI000648DA97|nr:GNAT family N-acetyltransferase [Cellulophaga sp. Hel_I_12]
MASKQHIVFNTHLIKGEALPDFFTDIDYYGREVSLRNSYTADPKLVYSMSLVPSYFKLQTTDAKIEHQIIPQENWGYAIHLNSESTIDSYLENQFKYKYRSIIRRFVNRLEASFNINYALYYGEISEEKYHFLMDALERMIQNRFAERNEKHKDIAQWLSYKKTSFAKINNKQASLFVIYNENEPIEISLNYHFDKILFSAMSSYDIDYSKFGLGHIEIYKQVEWCANNKYLLFEMGVGGMDYKRRWSNAIYRFQHHIMFSKSHAATRFLGMLEAKKIQLKEYLKAKKLNEILPELRRKFHREKDTVSPIDLGTIDNRNHTTVHKKSIEINIHDVAFKYLKRYTYDFLYTALEKSSEVKIYQLSLNEFLIQGNKKQQRLRLTKP